MKENPESGRQARGKRSPFARRPFIVVAAVLAIVQACLTIEGRGIEGFVLWILILFVGYWLLFTLLAWLWRRYKDRA